MVFSPGESTKYEAGVPKGMQLILMERGLYHNKLAKECKKSCPLDSTDCCGTRVLSLQPDFLEQKSLVEEIIEEAGTFLGSCCRQLFSHTYFGQVIFASCSRSTTVR